MTYKGIQYQTFKKTCIIRNIVINNKYWYNVMEEITNTKLPNNIRNTFVLICINCNPTKPKSLFKAYKKNMMEDYLRQFNEQVAEQYLLTELKRIFIANDSALENFNIPIATMELIIKPNSNRNNKDLANKYLKSLNKEQLICYEQIINAIKKRKSTSFIMDAPGGCGKTYLWETLYYNIISK